MINSAIKDYQLIKPLGKGSFGEVFLTQKKNSPQLLATKRIEIKQLKDPLNKKYLQYEIDVMKQLRNHPNIIKLIDLIQTPNHFYVIMEYCNGGSLSDCLEKYGKPFPIEIIQYLMRQIVEGLKYIHSKKIIHRDIKLENILVNFKNKDDKNNFNLLKSDVKIIDFGLSKILGEEEFTRTALGSPLNMDPVILNKYNKAGGIQKLQGYNEKADIWSLGTICYEMLTGEKMFNAYNMEELIEKVEEGNYAIPLNNNLSNELISFLNGMLQYQSEFRLSAEELSKHPFLVKNVKSFSKANLNKVSGKIDGSNIIINTKNNMTIKEIFSGKNEKEEWRAYMNGLSEEYKAAKDYFSKNKLLNQENYANFLCKQIQNIKAQYESGNNSYLTYLPMPITPEFIYGYSSSERNKKFQDIYNKSISDKIKLETKINSYNILHLQNNNELKKNYSKDINDLQIVKNNLLTIQNTINNKWVPAPIYFQDLQLCQTDKNKNEIKIQIKRDDNIKENLDLIILIKTKELVKLRKEIILNKENNFKEEIICIFNKKEWNNIDDYFIIIEKNKNNPNDTNAKAYSVNIGNIKTSRITFNCLMSENKKENVNIFITSPLLDKRKSLSNGTIEGGKVIFYPEFTGRSPVTEKISHLLLNKK